jgi:hypothetical protein
MGDECNRDGTPTTRRTLAPSGEPKPWQLATAQRIFATFCIGVAMAAKIPCERMTRKQSHRWPKRADEVTVLPMGKSRR